MGGGQEAVEELADWLTEPPEKVDPGERLVRELLRI